MRASQQCLFRCCEKLPRRFVPLVHYSCLVPSATHSANQITPICKPVLCVLLLHYYHDQMYPFWKIFRAYVHSFRVFAYKSRQLSAAGSAKGNHRDQMAQWFTAADDLYTTG